MFKAVIWIMEEDAGNCKMNRSVATTTTYQDADDHTSFWLDKTPLERLDAACFIINNIYNVTPQTKVDRTVVSSRKHGNG